MTNFHVFLFVSLLRHSGFRQLRCLWKRCWSADAKRLKAFVKSEKLLGMERREALANRVKQRGGIALLTGYIESATSSCDERICLCRCFPKRFVLLVLQVLERAKDELYLFSVGTFPGLLPGQFY